MNFDEFPDRYKEKCRKWDKEKIKENFGEVPQDIIPMWIADMDFQAPDILLKKLHETVDIGVFGYTYVYNDFFDSIRNYYLKHHHAKISDSWVTLCYGTVSTLHYTVQAFCREGDRIILQTPVYSPFQSAAKSQGVSCITNPLIIQDNRYMIDFTHFEYQLKTQRPKLYLMCSPHNPSGRIWNVEELERVFALCKKYNTIVVADEVHSGMIYEGPYTSISELGDCFDQAILLSSPNKKYNLGGLKTSFSIIKNEQIRNQFRSQLKKNSITSPNVFGILALTACMDEGDAWSEECMRYIYKNYQFAIDYIKNHLPMLSYMNMESSYLMWLDIRKTNKSSDRFTSELARNYGVLLESGSHFVENGEGFIRINLGTQYANVKECFLRIHEYLKQI